jgi:DNA (cytosine-5)-methyltransferase 1
MSLVVCSLFTGIGGIELAAQQLGGSTKLLCDIDPAARLVLKSRFPTTRIADDVMALEALPKGIDLVAAGFPCQNLSMAGDKSGIHGSKSGVVSKVFRLLSQQKAPHVIIENVPFMLHLDGGAGMRWLVCSLEELGYKWAYRTLDTMEFGLPQRRRRIYLVASTTLDPATVLFSEWHALREVEEITLDKPIGFYWTEGRSGVGLTQDGLPPIKAGSTIGIRSPPAVLLPSGEVRLPPIDACERLQGFPRHWTTAAEGLDPRGRWRLVGNAVSVPVAKWVLGRLSAKPSELPVGTRLAASSRWPANAYGYEGKRWAVELPETVKRKARPSLETFTPHAWDRISYRALKGFYDRASSSNLKWPRGFLTALQTELQAIKP